MPDIKPPTPLFIEARHHGGHQNPQAIVIHGTVSPCDRGRARSIAAWWHGPSSPVTSAHYVVDPGEVVQCVGDHSIAYHCGYNAGSIGVELCDPQTGPGSRWHDKPHKAMLARAAALVARLCVVYDIAPRRPSVDSLRLTGPHGIYGHDDSRRAFGHTTHTDPGPDFPWEDFLAAVRREMDQLKEDDMTIDELDEYLNSDRGRRTLRRAVLADVVPNNRDPKGRANAKNDRIWLSTAIARILDAVTTPSTPKKKG